MEFTKTLSIEATPAAHHRLLIEHLERLDNGEFDNLMVFMPPGSAKSTYATVLFPAWLASRHPKKNTLCVSYAQDLADDFGGRVRNIVGSQEFYDISGVTLSEDSAAKGQWRTNTGHKYRAAGAGGPITGFRADYGIIDDPVKGAEEAASPAMKKKIRNWYTSDFKTRLKPHAKQVLIMTRWAEDDLAGWLLEEMAAGGAQWKVLRLPMIAEIDDPLGRAPGQQLWAEWFTPSMVAEAMRDHRTWNALYQQRPSPLEGAFFKRDHLRFYDHLPANLKYYGSSDYAVTGGGGDYTVHMVFGVDESDNIYLVEVWREQAESLQWVEAFLDLMERFHTLMWAEEKGQIIKSLDPFIIKRMRERRVYGYRQQFNSATSKEMRAQAIQGRMSMGMVFLPKNAPWLADLIHELLTFPGGKNDDMVDCMSLFGRMLATISKASPPASEKKIKTLNEATMDDMWRIHEQQRDTRERIR